MSGFVNLKFWKEFIQIYESLPSLWKVKDNVYHNRRLKVKAYKILAEKLREIIPDANIEMVKKKINTMRTCYRRELKKVKDSERSGASMDEIYKSSLWYFDDLRFINEDDIDAESSRKRQKRIDRVTTTTRTDRVKKPLVTDAKVTLRSGQQQQDDAASFGIGWVTQFRMLDPTQQIYANKMINEVLYHGILGNLGPYSYKVLDSLYTDKTTQHLPGSFSPSYLSSSSNAPSPTTLIVPQRNLYQSPTSSCYTASPAVSQIPPLTYIAVQSCDPDAEYCNETASITKNDSDYDHLSEDVEFS